MLESTPGSTPGNQAILNLKNLHNVPAEFKTPLVVAAKRKQKPKILTEEKYIEELSKIIQRDFFPDLDKLRAQNEYLDALENKDVVKMAAIRAKYSGRQPTERSRSMTPASFETPASAKNFTPPHGDAASVSDTPKSTTSRISIGSSVEGSRKSLSEKHSLDSFLQQYTSEDNHSFQDIIETAEQKLRQKFAVLYNEEHLSKEKLSRSLALPSIEQQFEEPDPMRQIETWTYKSRNSIMYIPDGVELTEEERVEAVNRKQIIHHNGTRLATCPFEVSDRQKTPAEGGRSGSQVLCQKIAMDGNAVIPIGAAEPQIRGFQLVKTPSPRPGEAFSPLMTWGEIEGTPFRLDGSDTPVHSHAGPSFKINESSRRETIGLALAEKVGEKLRTQKKRAMNTARKNIGSPFLRSNTERLASMSPAARHLATTKLGLHTPIMTPSPQRFVTRSTKHNSAAPAVARKTPIVSAPNTPKKISSGKSTLTDNLLSIPTKRLKASDFF